MILFVVVTLWCIGMWLYPGLSILRIREAQTGVAEDPWWFTVLFWPMVVEVIIEEIGRKDED